MNTTSIKPLLSMLACALAVLTPVIPSLGWSAGTGQAAAAPIRIMPLGDSITYGVGDTLRGGAGYRYALLNKLNGAGVSVDFVGGLASGNMVDRENEGHASYLTQWLSDLPIESRLTTYHPDVILLLTGSNNINWAGADVAAAVAALETLVGRILAASPNVTLLVASIPPRTYNRALDANMDPAIRRYNAGVQAVVNAHSASGGKVGFVDLYPSLNDPATDFNDRVHPSTLGYAKMAEPWYQAILRYLPAAAPTANPTVVPTANPTVMPMPTSTPTSTALVVPTATAAPTFTATRTLTPTATAVDPSSHSRVIFGARVGSRPNRVGNEQLLASNIGRTPTIRHWYWSTGSDLPGVPGLDGDASKFQRWAATVQPGQIVMLSFAPVYGGVSTLPKVIAGQHDAYIHGWATALREYGGEVWLRPLWDDNTGIHWWSSGGHWDIRKGQYKQAFAHIREVFTLAGATNVKFVWSPSLSGNGASAMIDSYPGDSVVDLIGLNGYPGQSGRASDFYLAFKDDYAVARATGKPVMIAEVSYNVAYQADAVVSQYVANVLATVVPSYFSDLKALVWWSEPSAAAIDLTDSARYPRSIAAFKASLAGVPIY